MEVRFVLSLVFALLVAVFALQNSSPVSISFLFAKFNISQALVILLSTVVGAIIVLILSVLTQTKLNHKLKESAKTISRLEEENRLLADRIEELAGKGNVNNESGPVPM